MLAKFWQTNIEFSSRVDEFLLMSSEAWQKGFEPLDGYHFNETVISGANDTWTVSPEGSMLLFRDESYANTRTSLVYSYF